MTAQEVRSRLHELADENYRRFSVSLIPGCNNLLGVRLPLLRQIAKSIAKEDWCTFLQECSDETFEEVMLQGMVIGAVRGLSTEEHLKLVERFVPKISNWSLCDSFCAGLSFVKQSPQQVWEFLSRYYRCDSPFENRFAVVMTLDWFAKERCYLQPAMQQMARLNTSHLYVRLAVAWAFSVFFVYFPNETKQYLFSYPDLLVQKKAVQKVCESHRVDQQTKDHLRQLLKNSPYKE